MIDLRSDTVTRPTPAMRRAMAEAEVGDDVYGEDPTVNRLQELAAATVGKEAALFVPSGTMGNQIAIAVHAGRGTEVLCEADAHVIQYEMASMAVVSGCMPRPIATPDGILRAGAIRAALRVDRADLTRAGVIVVENTHNLASGAVTPLDDLDGIAALSREISVPLHMDGARIFNAALASGVAAARVAEGTDSVMFCLSKGLCAPVGSLLAGTREFIREAWRWRKRLGGGMRQAGVLAAAGIVALETMVDRLREDHENAGRLASGLAGVEGLRLDTPEVLTNIIYVRVEGAAGRNREITGALAAAGVLCNPVGSDRIRFVTHHDVSAGDIDTALEQVRAASRAS